MNNYNNKKVKKKKFLNRFYPTYMYDKVEDIPFELIKKENIKFIIFDMDNTLIDVNKKYNDKLKSWIKSVKNMGTKLYILSNSPFEKKVKKIANELEMEYKFNATKPFLKGFKEVIKDSNVDIKNIVMVGDQIFTDIWGANRMGIKTILVNPINKKESIFSKIKRPLEKIILKKYEKSNNKL